MISFAMDFDTLVGNEPVDKERREPMDQAPGGHGAVFVLMRMPLGRLRDLQSAESSGRRFIQPGYFARSARIGPNIRRNRPRFCKANST